MSSARIPLIVFGDGPRLATGLARIARDLTRRLIAEEEALGIRVLQVGVDDVAGWSWREWPFWGFQPNFQDQGRGAISQALTTLDRVSRFDRPIVFTIQDPARIYDLVRPGTDQDTFTKLPADIWSYFPIDAQDTTGGIGGPAAEAVARVDRRLAYTPYGADVLAQTLPRTHAPHVPHVIAHLPHGIDPTVFHPLADDTDDSWGTWFAELPSEVVVVGCVATNQPRKDLGLLFAAVAQMQLQGVETAVWLHTDRLTDYWDVGTLVASLNLRKDRVFVSATEAHGELPDEFLATRYRFSDVMLAPGLGEGFGYPIVEAAACGTPTAHVAYAGGANLVPTQWLIEPAGFRIEGIYALLRPVLSPVATAEKLIELAGWDEMMGSRAAVAKYCMHSVSHLHWDTLWPKWRSWFQDGLRPLQAHYDRGGLKAVTRG